jgi:HEAT repeat protein
MLGDWFYWLIGGLLGTAGVILALWSLFADRARGRKRCPKCWYDMSGIVGDPPHTCPECGKVIKREKRLHKTRRRWWWATAALIALVASLTVSQIPKLASDDPLSVIPSSVLIAAAGLSDNNWVWETLTDRCTKSGSLYSRRLGEFGPGEFTDWQWRLLAWSCSRSLAADRSPRRRADVIDLLGLVPPHAETTFDQVIACIDDEECPDRDGAAWVIYRFATDDRLDEEQRSIATDAIAEYLREDEYTGDCAAILAMTSLDPDGDRAVPALLEIARGENGRARSCAIDALVELRTDLASLRPVLLRELADPDSFETPAVLLSLGQIMGDDSECADAVSRFLNDPDDLVRLTAAEALATNGAKPDQVIPVLEAFMTSEDTLERMSAAEALGGYTDHADRCVPLLVSMFDDPESRAIVAAAESLAKFGPRAIDARQELLELLLNGDWMVQDAARKTLESIEEDASPDAGD